MNTVCCIHSFRDFSGNISFHISSKHNRYALSYMVQLINLVCVLTNAESAIINVVGVFFHDDRAAYPNRQAQVFTNSDAANVKNKPLNYF